jgi:hypothetical protein
MKFAENNTLKLERTLLGDAIYIQIDQIRCITGAPDPRTPQGQIPPMLDGACTIYLEGDLGFTVNNTQEEVLGAIRAAQVVQ